MALTMNRRMRLARIQRVVVAPAAALLLAACGGGSNTQDTAPRSLDEHFGFDLDSSSDKERRAEVEIQMCMDAQGFEYQDVDPAARRATLLGSTGLSDSQFEEQYGYGITTLYKQRRLAAVDEPNQKIRATLNEAERAAYDRALRGDNLGATLDDAIDSGDFSRLGGCTRLAAEKAYGGEEFLRSVQTGLDELEARVLTDPRMVKAVSAWSGCMRAQGYELTSSDEVDVVLKRKLTAIVGEEAAGADPGAPPAYDQAALGALQEEEVRMVAADVACEDRHISAVEDEVRAVYEAEFREENVDLMSKVPRS